MTTRNLRPLQRTIGAFAVLPVLSGLGEALLGPRAVPGGSPAVLPTVDSAFRYANTFKVAAGLTLWTELGRVDRSPATTTVLATVAVGGAVRLLSWRQHGRPHPAIVAATVGETVLVPIIIAWRRRLQNSLT